MSTPYYSQYQQDEFIDSHFQYKRDGVFVDIGAHDGINISNSYFLETNRGWTGLCVEANPDVHESLVKNRPNPQVHKECVAVYDKDDQEITFLQITGYSEMLSGVRESYDPRHEQRIERELSICGGQAKPITVRTSTLKTLLNKYGLTHVDYLSIDTEGSELNILKGIDWNAVYIDVIGVEINYDKQGQEIAEYMESLNMYDVILKYKTDWFYKRREEIKSESTSATMF
jgi:FkbM family methyltransferase